MDKMYFFDVHEWEQPAVDKACRTMPEIVAVPESLSIESLKKYPDAQKAQVISVFITSHIDKRIFDLLPHLKLIATRSTGFDHIDIREAQARGVTVCYVPSYGEHTVAEFAFGLILALSRKIVLAHERVQTLNFSCNGLTGFDLKGKTIGIIGLGNIGVHMARIAHGFSMRVIAFDTKPKEKLAQEEQFSYATDLSELLQTSDIITLHVPYNKHTHHLISTENISLIKPGALLINTARGSVVETEALIKALDTGLLAGVGLDVIEGEQDIIEEEMLILHDCKQEQLKNIVMEHVLLHRENVVITPHNAFNSKEALERIIEITINNIQKFFAKTPINTCNG